MTKETPMQETRTTIINNTPNNKMSNMSGMWGKLNNLAEDMHERGGDIVFLCEVWEKSESKKHKRRIEHLLEMKQISYISTPRPGAKRGGGLVLPSALTSFQYPS